MASTKPMQRWQHPEPPRCGWLSPLILTVAATVLAACGGGGSSPPESDPPPFATDAVRVQAAQATAQSASNLCAVVRPFYWEVGDRSGSRVSGSVLAAGSTLQFNGQSVMSIASASKWLYGAYVAELRNGVLTESDVKFLSFRSGYTSFDDCERDQTVQSCLDSGDNGVYSASRDGLFFYNSGHMQSHGVQIGLGPLDNAGLATTMVSQLGGSINFIFLQPQLAGGVASTPANYAVFLRKVLDGSLRISDLLGYRAVCANPVSCPTAAAPGGTPIPLNLTWHYSMGHWVEDDPLVGDGAFSSLGAFGFYPWIDSGRTHYGIVARVDATNAFGSAECGRLIRQAWVTGVPQ